MRGLSCFGSVPSPASFWLGGGAEITFRSSNVTMRKKIKTQDRAIQNRNLGKQWHLGFPLSILSVDILQSRNYRRTFSIWAELLPLPQTPPLFL